MERSIRISVCIPAFNEENSLKEATEELLSAISSRVKELEVIIVNDGSIDSTPRIAEQIAKEYSQVKVIHHKRNLGIGACYRDALTLAGGDYFTWFPADHENSAEQFIQCLPYLNQDTAVSYYHIGGDNRLFLRRILSRIYIWIINKYFRLNLKYYNDLTVFPINKLRSFSLVANGSFLFAESLIKAAKHGCRIIELPTPLRGREEGNSKTFTFGSLLRMTNDIYRIFMNKLERLGIKR